MNYISNESHETRRVGILGATGRMGRVVCETVAAAPDLDLVAAVDQRVEAAEVVGLDISPGLDRLLSANLDVVVDFTVADAARANLPLLAEEGVHVVVGTSGLNDNDVTTLDPLFTSSACLIVPNFAIGAVLMQRFAEMAAPWFETAEIVELHHDEKVDAPSGTALVTAERMAMASDNWASDPTENETFAGVRGGIGPGGIRIHAVRMRGMVAHQEVVLGTTGQTLTIRHDAIDRSSFMPGVILAIRGVGGIGCVVGLDALLGI